ncbi:ABC transporter ATP-binding protein [[Ruminococcus] gnavus]|uniref:ABC transporter ATP-binding protein n=1 Tax=Mediterraneibacter gnavus TaxID=33038 RepID=A0AAP3QPY6_MEDGN|nr:ABC transporter ATP-binding protein [Mediterraneibacter gnavus]MDB8697791.1 ABC transporter ATP-binding protein [Mediterraneibacter gnavus]MDB8725967.1 ABC transporter ATP-binding protein [Mediterraneibacter gnavus]MDB8729534.1 ABC transporter ATP-binding protein [Mediterraneibacter gnavus]MDB8731757.1 ABC transporter ATP-binding protein [Mediterraneibacter gnavus]MDB8738253.1 ABC transporter ATP-binding protein [Mediterraneibacter gnavus]
MNAIQLSNLTKYYGKSRGILNLNLDVKEGEFFGFIGPNGAGKSTTIRTLLGLITPSSGQAKIFDETIRKRNPQIRSHIGYLPSEAVFYRGMKVKDLLKLSADLHHKNCSAEREILCRRLQLDVNRKVDELSFGNRKKVAIVSALQHQPKLLILDEPTSGLDPLMQREFFHIIRERNEQGATVFLSSHVLSEIQRNCTRAAIIREGRIIACDRVEALSKTNAKRISVQGQVSLDSLEEIRDLKENDGVSSFLYGGDIHRLLETLSAGTITDLSISDPDLDEIFLHYYENGGEQV